jgi:outer membrane biosynthesis protein TonB
MDLLSFGIAVVVCIGMLHLTAFWVLRQMHPPEPEVAFTQPAPVIVNDHPKPVEEPVQTETTHTERELSVIIPTIPDDPPVQRDTGVDIPDA